MKDKDHHMRHPRGHLGDRASAQGTRGCAWRDDQFGRGQNTVLGWSDPTFAHGSVAKSDAWGRSSPRGDSSPCFARVCRRILGRNLCRKRVNKVKTVRITLCTFRTATSSPNARPTEFILKRSPAATIAKVTAQKRANRAGATPFFGSQSAQKICPGRSRPLLHSGAHVFSPRAKQPRSWPSNPPSQELRVSVLCGCIHRPEDLSDKRSDTLYENERRSQLSILKSPPKQPKAVAIQARVEESVKA